MYPLPETRSVSHRLRRYAPLLHSNEDSHANFVVSAACALAQSQMGTLLAAYVRGQCVRVYFHLVRRWVCRVMRSLLLFLAATLAGCASRSGDIAPSYVSPVLAGRLTADW
jgi:hypothetical protein